MNGFSSLAEAIRIGARMMLQSAVEEEVTAFLGRDYYEKGDMPPFLERYKYERIVNKNHAPKYWNNIFTHHT